MSAQSRPDNETTLSAFVSPAAPEPDPTPAEDYDGLQAVAASVSGDFTTTQAREDRNDERVTDGPLTRRVGDEKAAMDDLTDALGGGR